MPPSPLRLVSDSAVRKVATWPLVISAVRRALVAAAAAGTTPHNNASSAAASSAVFPVVLGRGSHPGTGWGAKSGLLGATGKGENALAAEVGVKVGSYWPGNRTKGLAAHGSTTLLLDDATGFPRALVNAHYLNGLRTAAANALACDALAAPDAANLVLFGAGGQALFEAQAICQVRPLRRITIVNRTRGSADALAVELRAWLQSPEGAGLARPDTEVAVLISTPDNEGTAEEGSTEGSVLWRLVADADIITTVTPRVATDGGLSGLFPAAALSPATHISAMGADGPGKGELSVVALAEMVCVGGAGDGSVGSGAVRFFADYPEQSFRVGELQHLPESRRGSVTAIGELLRGGDEDDAGGNEDGAGGAGDGDVRLGRDGRGIEADAITVFDSSGIALQDVAAAAAVLAAADAAGLTQTTDF
jgi:ornithine cyclodeaminase